MKFHYNLIGVPRLTETTFNKYKDVSNIPPDELNYLVQFRNRFKKSHAVWPLIAWIFILAQTYYLYFIMLYATEPATLVRNNNGTSLNYLRKLSCLITDCPHLNLNYLPFFTICNPTIGHYYGPPAGLYLFGYNIQTIFIFSVLLVGCIAPIVLYMRPQWFETYVFVVVPTCIQNSHRQQIKSYLRDFHVSLKNHLQNSLSKRNGISSYVEQLLERDNRHTLRYNNRMISYYIKYSSLQVRQFDLDLKSLSNKARDYVEDCMSVFRSDWWKQKQCKSMNYAVLINSILGHGIWLLFSVWIINMSEERNLELEGISRTIKGNRCHLWSIAKGERERKEVDLSKVVPEVTIIVVGQLFITVVPIILILSTALATFFHSLIEFYNSIVEQIDRIILANELAFIFIASEKYKFGSKIDPDPQEVRYKLASLKQRHKSLINRSLLLEPFSCRKYLDKDDPTKFAQKLALKPPNLDSLLEVFMKVYVGIRHLFYSSRLVSDSLGSVLIISIILCYGYVVIVVYFNNKLRVANNMPIIFGLSAAFANNVFILLTSRSQSQSRLLCESFWRLLATTSELKDIRIKHVRTIWLKQMISINQGALALKILGIPITYATVFKLTIWTSTIILLSNGARARDTSGTLGL